MEVTIGDIKERLEQNIFSINEDDPHFIREKRLKEHINLCIKTSFELSQIPEETPNTLSYYKNERIKRNLRRISDYVGYLTNELDEQRIKNSVETNESILYNDDIDIGIILSNSYYGSIKHDIYWIDNLKYIDFLQISRSDFDIKRLEGYLPECINHFEQNVIPFFQKDIFFYEFSEVLKEIKECISNNTFRAANLLVITIIEGIVRKLGEFLIEKQNLNVNVDAKTFNSLDGFLRKIEWKKDYGISKFRFRLKTASFEYKRDKNPEDEILISLHERLDFLRRRFKENRDLVLHGLEKDYGTPWNLFINLSALNEVSETVQNYRRIYKS